jgi:hypothetical protein
MCLCVVCVCVVWCVCMRERERVCVCVCVCEYVRACVIYIIKILITLFKENKMQIFRIAFLMSLPMRTVPRLYIQNNSIDCYHLMTKSLFGEAVIAAAVKARIKLLSTTLLTNKHLFKLQSLFVACLGSRKLRQYL